MGVKKLWLYNKCLKAGLLWYAEFLKLQEKNFVLPCIKIVPVRYAPGTT